MRYADHHIDDDIIDIDGNNDDNPKKDDLLLAPFQLVRVPCQPPCLKRKPWFKIIMSFQMSFKLV